MSNELITMILTIGGINIALFAALATLVIWSVNKLDADIKSTQSDHKIAIARLDGHAKRMDQLYKIIIDLLKVGKNV